MNNAIKNDMTDQLFQCILQLQSLEECYDLFEDLCTIHEIQTFAQRLAVAKMLIDKNTYSEIADKTGASTATISRVNRALTYGTEGYCRTIHRLQENK